MLRRLFLSKPFGFVTLCSAAVWKNQDENAELAQEVAVDAGIHVEYIEKPLRSGIRESVFRYGQPIPYLTLAYSNHVVFYDLERRIPRYVAERITKEHISGQINRNDVPQENGGFKPDPSVENMFSSTNADFAGSGWSRGHMAAAANHKHDLTAMSDTFFLTNIVPQDFDNNSGFWNRLEWFCRGLAKKYDAVYVITGPLFIAERRPGVGPKGEEKRLLNVDLIGRSGVHVPTHLYKAILVEKKGKPFAIAAFVVPNKPIPLGTKISDYQVPVGDLERIAGMKFFNLARSAQIADLCRSDDSRCRLSAEDEKRFAEFEKRGRGEWSARKEKAAASVRNS